MATQTSLFLLSILIVFSALMFKSLEACGITIYWGQNGDPEGTIREACATGYYQYLSIAFLTIFGGGQTPVLNLTGHCSGVYCSGLANEIKYRQCRGIKVLLSLGGPAGNYTLSSAENAQQVANYLWEVYLGGILDYFGPPVVLDGIDFDIEDPLSTLYWDDLATALVNLSMTAGTKIYLSAAPKCGLADPNLDAAISTGLFDYVWVQFYNNAPCDYNRGVDALLDAWNSWSSYLPEGNQLSLGLPASRQAADSEYISPDELDEILPQIANASNYGGVMLWNMYYDIQNDAYSSTIYPAACNSSNTLFREELLISQVV